MREQDMQITPEEKEMLRRLMETPGNESKWDFFDEMNTDKPIPPPEYFMRGKPKPRRRLWMWYVIGGAAVAALIIIYLNR